MNNRSSAAIRFAISSSRASEKSSPGDAGRHPGPRADVEGEAGEAADPQAVLEDPLVLHVPDGDGRLEQAEAGDLLRPAEEGQRDRVSAAEMAGARRRGHVAEGLGERGARIVAGDLELLDRHGQLGAAVARREAGGALGHRVADAAPVSDRPDELLLEIAAAEAKIDPAEVGGRDRPALRELHGAGERAAEAHRVDAELVAAVVGPGDRGQVVDVADRAHHDHGLVLGPLPFLGPAVRLEAGVALAADGAEEAAARPLQDGLGDRLARDVLEQRLVVVRVLEIPVGEHPDDVDELDEPGRAQLAHEALGDRAPGA